ncbi:MAG: sulfate/molybdate ABC transporter ATP-binding protein [bacterium]
MALHVDAAISFGRFALDAAFAVEPGEVVALVGPNGSGKTTCLGVIAGLLRPDRARIVLGERVLMDTERGVDVPPERRGVGLLFQDFALFPHLTVEDNVRYGARSREAPRAWLERLGIAALAHERNRRLSGGQRQRVALARALAAEPEALLLDEPLAALDVATRASVRAELRRFLADVGLPTIVVTHDPVDALVLGTRIVVLEEGRVTQAGPLDELLGKPRTAFVAQLTGRNLLRARLREGTGLRAADAGAVQFHVLSEAASGAVLLSFLPQDVALTSARPAGSAQNVFPAAVRELVPLPDRSRAVLDVSGETVLADITPAARESLGVEPGTKFWVSIKATAIQVVT